MFKIKELADDADANIALAVAFIVTLLAAFLPDVAWDRLVERGTYLATVGGGVFGVIVMRYLLRIAGAFQTGKVLAAAAADPHGPDGIVGLVEHGSDPSKATLPGGSPLTDGDLAELARANAEAG